MRKQAEETLKFLSSTAKRDVELLIQLQLEIVSTSYRLQSDECRKLLGAKIIPQLDKLIIRQAELLRKCHCPIMIQTSNSFKKNILNDVEQHLIQHMDKGDYLSALIGILTFNSEIPYPLAERLYHLAIAATDAHPIDSESFLEVLHLRLFSSHALHPRDIDYSTLANNKLLQDPNIRAIEAFDAMTLSVIYQDAASTAEGICEKKLNGSFQQKILDPIKTLVNSLKMIYEPPSIKKNF